MARLPRVLLPDIPLHIIQWGNNRSACFYSDEDYVFILEENRGQTTISVKTYIGGLTSIF